MKIAIPTKNNQVDNHFGHCDHFTVVTVENKTVVATEKVESGNSCGCKSNVVIDLKNIGVTTLLAGQMGQGAINKVTSNGIEVVRGCEGDVNTLINEYIEGKIQDKYIVCSPDEHGHECSHN